MATEVSTSTGEAALQRFNSDTEYVNRHWEQLRRQFPGCWIAVYDQHVAGASPVLEQLLGDLRARGIPPEHAAVWHAGEGDQTLILG